MYTAEMNDHELFDRAKVTPVKQDFISVYIYIYIERERERERQRQRQRQRETEKRISSPAYKWETSFSYPLLTSQTSKKKQSFYTDICIP